MHEGRLELGAENASYTFSANKDADIDPQSSYWVIKVLSLNMNCEGGIDRGKKSITFIIYSSDLISPVFRQ